MNKTISLLLLFGIVTILPAYALDHPIPTPLPNPLYEGRTMSQSDIDSIDATTAQLECRQENQIYFMRSGNQWLIAFDYSCLTIQDNADGSDMPYVVRRSYPTASYPYNQYVECLDSLQEFDGMCDYLFYAEIGAQVHMFALDIRNTIRNYQTSEEPPIDMGDQIQQSVNAGMHTTP